MGAQTWIGTKLTRHDGWENGFNPSKTTRVEYGKNSGTYQRVSSKKSRKGQAKEHKEGGLVWDYRTGWLKLTLNNFDCFPWIFELDRGGKAADSSRPPPFIPSPSFLSTRSPIEGPGGTVFRVKGKKQPDRDRKGSETGEGVVSVRGGPPSISRP